MRPAFLISALFINMLGCNNLSPFVSEDLKTEVCDRDADGLARSSTYCSGTDCDDTDARIGSPTGWFRDVDLDGFGAGEEAFACSQPEGFVDHNSDCDDTDKFVHPQMSETCNGIDDNCDGAIDDENITVWYQDADLDTYGNSLVAITQCNQPDGYVENPLDCDDGDPQINPDGTEICNDGIDQDCNGITDDATGSQTWYADSDGDGYGNASQSFTTCLLNPTGYVADNTDCNDTKPDINPGAAEACKDGVDNNCNGQIDETSVTSTWYKDGDGDGYGTTAETIQDCAPSTGYVGNSTDCDDVDASIHPGVDELCKDGIDNNCDGSPNECELTGVMSLADSDAIIRGTETGSYTGVSLANAGDFNGDGYEDLLVGASQAHKAYLFLGPIIGSLDVSMANYTFIGPNGSFTGTSVTGGCDLENDGYSNILISGPYDSQNGSQSGTIWILNGTLAPGSYVLEETPGVKLVGIPNSLSGSSLSCSGDVNDDGYNDLLIGAIADSNNGAAYIVYGPPVTGSLMDHVKLTGENNDDGAGVRVLIAGDLNSDGYDDVVVGAHQEDTNGSSAGAIYIVYGPAITKFLKDADAKLLGEAASNFAGRSLSKLGDVNKDGYADLLIGAYQESSAGQYAGATYIVYGPPASGSLAAYPKITGEAANDNSGYALGGECDMNGDDSNDFFIGARDESANGSEAGALYLLYGPITESTGLSSSDLKLVGEMPTDYAGTAVATLDLNADGYCDIAIGAYLNDTNQQNAGAVYVLYGTGL
ncbi:TPA: hypothetical protein DCW61_02405 [Candidatus Uhrbacteria bacterium]|nr:hypothetical protein [Candidatus Uhrbacteria bacterium]